MASCKHHHNNPTITSRSISRAQSAVTSCGWPCQLQQAHHTDAQSRCKCLRVISLRAAAAAGVLFLLFHGDSHNDRVLMDQLERQVRMDDTKLLCRLRLASPTRAGLNDKTLRWEDVKAEAVAVEITVGSGARVPNIVFSGPRNRRVAVRAEPASSTRLEQRKREEAERLAREKAEAERRQREEEDRKHREEQERLAREKAEAERRAREEVKPAPNAPSAGSGKGIMFSYTNSSQRNVTASARRLPAPVTSGPNAAVQASAGSAIAAASSAASQQADALKCFDSKMLQKLAALGVTEDDLLLIEKGVSIDTILGVNANSEQESPRSQPESARDSNNLKRKALLWASRFSLAPPTH